MTGVSMTARELFGVALRVLGIWFLYNAADEALWAFFRRTGIVRDASFPLPVEDKLAEHAILGVFYLVLALVLLAGADYIVLALYGPTRKPEPPSSGGPSD